MRPSAAFLLALCLALPLSTRRAAAETTHTVYPGQTLGRIAKRYNISIEALCDANGMTRRDRIKPGQRLVIPSANELAALKHNDESLALAAPVEPNGELAPEVKQAVPEPNRAPTDAPRAFETNQPRLPGGMQVLNLSGAAPAYFFEPSGPGRQSMRPVLVYLHGRGGHPAEDCRRWAPVARRIGWLVCPSGPGVLGDGREWNNNWISAQRAALGAVQALRERYGRRVQLWGNTLIGFSEGAYAAMNVGVREPHTFNRWLILAADTKYWGGPGMSVLHENRGMLKRVYLITGEHDVVVQGTRETHEWLEQQGVAARMTTPRDMGHELALQQKPSMYREALRWLQKGADKENREIKEKPVPAIAKNE